MSVIKNDIHIIAFQNKKIRRHWDSKKEKWYFSVVDIIAVLTNQPDHKKAQSYWTTLKNRLKAEGSEVVTKCDQLKLESSHKKHLCRKMKYNSFSDESINFS